MSALRRFVATSLLVAGSAAACDGARPQAAPIAVPAQPLASASAAPAASAIASAPPPAAPVAVDGPAPPPKLPIDPRHKVDGGALLLGSSPTELWLLVDDAYTVVVDRKTGCAVEGYPGPSALQTLQKTKDDAIVDAELARPEVLAAIRDVVGLGRRFEGRGHRFLLDLVWSPDGRHVFFEKNDYVYGSSDGGRSFARIDDHFGSRLAMSADGRHLVYERCPSLTCGSCARSYGPGCNAGREYVSLPTDRSRGPLPFTAGQTFLLDMTAAGRAIFWRSDASVCLDTFDLGKPARESAVCVAYPAKATGAWPSREWEAVSPSGKYGIVKWEEGRPNLAGVTALTYVVSLVELKSGQIVKTVLDVSGAVDDEGNMVLQSMQEGGGDHTYFYPLAGPRKLLGHHSLLAWREKEAILAVHRVAPLGARKCDLVESVKTP